MRAVLAMALAGLLCTPAQAHDVWQTGDPVPEWVKRHCCGTSDAHRLDDSQVHRVEGGWMVDGYPHVISEHGNTEILPSQDGAYWIFYSHYDSVGFSPVYCFFVPMSG